MIKSYRPHRDNPAVCQRCRNPAPPPRPCWVVEADECRYSWSRSKTGIEGIITFFSCCPSIIASREYKRGTSKSLNLCYLNPTEFPDLFCFPTVEKTSSSTHKPKCCQTSFEQKPWRSLSRRLVKVSKNEIICGLLAEVLECFHGCIA